MAVKRWKGVDTRSLFDEIEREADRYLKHAEEGAKLFVRFKFSRGIISDARNVDVKVWFKESWEDQPEYA